MKSNVTDAVAELGSGRETAVPRMSTGTSSSLVLERVRVSALDGLAGDFDAC